MFYPTKGLLLFAFEFLVRLTGPFILGMILVGVLGWGIRKLWRNAAGPALIAAAVAALIQLPHGTYRDAIGAGLAGLVWWVLYREQDAASSAPAKGPEAPPRS